MSFLKKVAAFLIALDDGSLDKDKAEKAIEEAMKPKYIELSEVHQKYVKAMEDSLSGKSDTTAMGGMIMLKDGETKSVSTVKQAKEFIEQIKLGQLELP